MVTNVAMVSVNTRIRRCGLSSPRMRLVTMFAQISTNATAPAMVMASFMPLVTASVGHMPSTCR